jgi:hypothetical protein
MFTFKCSKIIDIQFVEGPWTELVTPRNKKIYCHQNKTNCSRSSTSQSFNVIMVIDLSNEELITTTLSDDITLF